MTEEENVQTEQPKTTTSDRYPWHLLLRTILLLNAYLALGMNDAIRGPTLLDLKDLVDAKISEISFIFMLGSIGSLIGCFLMGIILDKLSRFRYLILSSTLIIIGFTNSLLPYCPTLLSMYLCVFIGGFGSGSLDTGGNVLLLDIWKGRDSGNLICSSSSQSHHISCLRSLHACFALHLWSWCLPCTCHF